MRISNINKQLKYRPDIDGLRAIAVISVIIFHLNPDWLPGGFIGVDIFFVISGYLITSIIYSEMKDNTFSFQKFYMRRVKRILPVFFAVILTTLGLGYLIMLPGSFYELNKSAFAALFFFSNIYFAKTGGYFENPDNFPLLHTWSLSVEEQYYLIWPIILLILFKLGYKHKKMITVTVSLLIISFTTAQIFAVSDKFSTLAYYLLPTRAGELLIGSILAFLHSQKNKEEYPCASVSGLAGIGLIILSLIFLQKNSIFPGINALWPTIGAGLIIYGNQYSFINKLLSLKPIVYTGLISYSLYLWHWPILAFLHYCYLTTNNELPLKAEIFALALTVILAILSYTLIEKPTRKMEISFPIALKYCFAPPATLVILIFIITFTTKGLPARYSSDIKKLTSFSGAKSCHNQSKFHCTIDNNKNNKAQPILIYGDSHAGQFEQFFEKIVAKDNNVEFNFLTADSCTIARDPKTMKSEYREGCKKNRFIFNKEADNYKTVILAGRWEDSLYSNNENKGNYTNNYIKKLNKFIEHLSKQGKKIIIIAQIPKYNIDVNRNEFVAKRLGFKIKYKVDKNYSKANEQLKYIARANRNVYILNFDELLCPHGKCSPYNDHNIIMYRDDNHMNVNGAESLADKFLHSDKYNWFEKIIKN